VRERTGVRGGKLPWASSDARNALRCTFLFCILWLDDKMLAVGLTK